MIDFNNILRAESIGCVTLVNHTYKEYPYPSGNCFSVNTKGENYKIVNFNYENLKELLKREIIDFPVNIIPISERQAVIHDERIPDEWYSKRFCEVCCPRNLLPLPQRLAYDRKLKTGEIEEHTATMDDGREITIVKHKIAEGSQKLKLEGNWKVEMGEGIVYAPYIPKEKK